MKNFKLLFLLIFPVLSGFSQNLSGVWIGTLSNDSLTVRKDQTFEIALTEYRGKVYGYVYSTFIVNDSLFYIIKKVKGDVKGNISEVKDDEVITHNFKKKPEKGVHVQYTFRHNQQENKWMIDGNWKTNATKDFYSVSGEVKAEGEKDLSRSRLYQHLGDLNLQHTLVSDKTTDQKQEKKHLKIKPAKDVVVKASEKSTEKKQERDIVKQNTIKEAAAEDQKSLNKTQTADIVKSENKIPKENNLKKDIVKTEIKKPAVQSEEVPAKENSTENKIAVDIVNNKSGAESKKADQKPVENKPLIDIAKSEIKKPDDKNSKQVLLTEAPEKNNVSEYVFADVKRTERNVKLAKAMVEERISVPSETIYFKSDSLVLALYDNGEIDGDTVSVILNGELIIEKQGLKSAAFKKTIYLAPDESDSVLLVLYAENLGLYPPNTGLLIIKDGEDSYMVRFNADYERNAAIMLRRKLK